MAHVGSVVLVSILVGMLCPHVGPPSEVAQGPYLALSLGYAPLEVMSKLGGGAALVNICESLLSAAVLLSPNTVIGIVRVGMRRAWVRSSAACVVESCGYILGKVSVARKKYVVSETISFAVLGM